MNSIRLEKLFAKISPNYIGEVQGDGKEDYSNREAKHGNRVLHLVFQDVSPCSFEVMDN